jgi:hypothetical protein
MPNDIELYLLIGAAFALCEVWMVDPVTPRRHFKSAVRIDRDDKYHRGLAVPWACGCGQSNNYVEAE